MPSKNSSLDQRTTTADLKDQAGEVADDLKELGRLARDVLAERADDLREGAAQRARSTRDSVEDAGEQLAERVRERPFRGLAIAAVAGALLGALWSRR